MKPFRKHVAIAIDGGGLRGVMVTTALEMLENYLGAKLGEVCQLAAGTSTGSVIATGIALNISAREMTTLYKTLAAKIFKKSWRTYLWFLASYRYGNDELKKQFDFFSQEQPMGALWTDARKFDLVIVVRDLHEARSRFIKPWKEEYRSMPITTAVMASAAAPTYFPVVEGRYIDGGVGSFGNPCFIAAYEAWKYQDWNLNDTTLISIGTGRLPAGANGLPIGAANSFKSIQWLSPLLDSFLSDAGDQQARVVNEFFPNLDFRRFQIETPAIPVDAVAQIDNLVAYGKKLGQMIINDETDPNLNDPAYRQVQ